MDLNQFKWIREPKEYHVANNRVEILTNDMIPLE